jgi:serine/threonine-protein kinase 24/25/MST4
MDAKQFELVEKIGDGAYSRVYKAKQKDTGQLWAIKVIDLEGNPNSIDPIQQEINTLSKFDSPLFTKYKGSLLKGTQLWIVIEYMSGGSVLDLLQSGPLDEALIAYFLREVCRGLESLHASQVLHRDIKAANILLSENGDVKLGDFGVSGQVSDSSKRYSLVGSPYWMAPEVITGKESGYNERADIWSLGITAIEMAKGFPPRVEQQPAKVVMTIVQSDPPKLEGNFSPNFKNFVAACLKKDPKERSTAKELLNHLFLKATPNKATFKSVLDRYRKWREAHPLQRDSSHTDVSETSESESIEWDLDTIRPKTTAGKIASNTQTTVETNSTGTMRRTLVTPVNTNVASNSGSNTPSGSSSPTGVRPGPAKNSPKYGHRPSDASNPPPSVPPRDTPTIVTPAKEEKMEEPAEEDENNYGTVVIRDPSTTTKKSKTPSTTPSATTPNRPTRDPHRPSRTPKRSTGSRTESQITPLHNVLIPAIQDLASNPYYEKVKELLSSLNSSLTQLESKTPGFTQDLLGAITQRIDKDPGLKQTLGVSVGGGKESVPIPSEFSEVTKMLLTRWKTKLERQNDEKYFVE